MVEHRAKILIVEDEPIKRSVLQDELSAAGYDVAAAASPLETDGLLDGNFYDVVVTDLRMPGQDGIAFLRDLKRRNPTQAAIVMTAYGSIETAVEAMKLGAFDYIQKPFPTEELLLKLDRIMRYEDLERENEALRIQLAQGTEETCMVGQSEAMRQVMGRIHAVAGTDTTVLIEGESGTGKELAARLLHETSSRSSGAFVAVSCAALPRELVESELFGYEAGAFTGASKRRIGRIELAHGGTLFLDDVDDVPIDVQVKLLRVLQNFTVERVGGQEPIRVNIRIISAAKKNLAALVAEGKWREDLYYRLNVVPLFIPPLRERLEDVPFLAEHFLQKSAIKLNRGAMSISPAAVNKLQAYHWPGNVRELEHVVERMVALTQKDTLDVDDVPLLQEVPGANSRIALSLEGHDRVDLNSMLAEVEAKLIRWALDRTKGNLAQAADMLAVPRSTLQYKVAKLFGNEAEVEEAGEGQV